MRKDSKKAAWAKRMQAKRVILQMQTALSLSTGITRDKDGKLTEVAAAKLIQKWFRKKRVNDLVKKRLKNLMNSGVQDKRSTPKALDAKEKSVILEMEDLSLDDPSKTPEQAT